MIAPPARQELGAVGGVAEDQEKGDPLQARFIKLARMARFGSGAREDNPPRQVRRPTPKLAIDEIGEAAEEQAEGDARRCQIGEAHQIHLVHAGEPDQGDDHRDQGAVERHAAVPGL